jgi:hypothetical protein
MQFKHWKTRALIVLSLALLTAVLAPEASADQNRLRVEIQEPFMIDGTLYPADLLTVREVGSYSPHAVFAEIWVGNECLGQLIAREDPRGLAAVNDSVVFTRDSHGTLVLVGLDFRGEPSLMLDSALRPEMLAASHETPTDTAGVALATSRPR